jgi:hypothetical protein
MNIDLAYDAATDSLYIKLRYQTAVGGIGR